MAPHPPNATHAAHADRAGRTGRRRLPRAALAAAVAVVALVAGGTALVRSRAGDGNGGATVVAPQDTTAGGAAGTTTPAPGITTDPATVIEVTPVDPATLAVTTAYGVVPLGRLAVVMAEGAGRAEADRAAAAIGGEVVGVLGSIGLYQLAFPPTDEAGLTAALTAIAAQPDVDLAFPEQTAVPAEEVWGVRQSPLDDTVYGGDLGAGYRDIGVQAAWDYLRGAGVDTAEVEVGVVDTGLWTGNGEFDGDIGVTFPDPAAGELASPQAHAHSGAPDPTGGHGTGVANIIGADPRNGGVAGVASVLGGKLTVSPVNTFTPPYGNEYQVLPGAPDPADPTQYSAHGRTYASGSLAALQKAVDSGATVVNLSYGCHGGWPETRDAYERFFAKVAADHPDVLFVVAAGNDAAESDGSTHWPGGIPSSNVVTVGNVNNDGTTNSSSNMQGNNFEVTLAAPGHEAVQGVGPDGTVVHTYGGTSMAAPQVTATAALLKSIKPDLTAAQLKAILASSARTGLTVNGVEQPIDPKLGGRLLATDRAVLAVLRLTNPAWATLDDAALGTLLTEQGVIDAVAVSGDQPGEWTVRGIVAACRGDCTEVSISVSGSGYAIGGDTTASLAAAGEVAWPVTLSEPEATIVVRRLDNGAASIITITSVDLNGTWSGTMTIATVNVAEGSPAAEEGCDPNILLGQVFGLQLQITAADGGGGTAVIQLTPPADLSSGGANDPIAGTLTWNGNSLTVSVAAEGSTMTMTGTAARSAGGIETITGSFSIAGEGATLAGPFTTTRQA